MAALVTKSSVGFAKTAGELGSKDARWPVDARVIAVCHPDDVDALRAAVSAGSFRDDLWRRLQHRVDLPPCHTLFQFKVEDGKLLHCQLYQRSADAFLGVPFNISSYALLMYMMAHVCGLGGGDSIYTLGDYHIYQNHLEQVEELLAREPYPLPALEIVDEGSQLKGLEGLLKMRYDNLKLVGYQSHGKIAASVAV
jgi:thymidylate synthase